jgi:hypothetical protein
VSLLSRLNLIVLKTKDICEALKIKRHQLRAWTEALQPYCNQSTQERSARKFDTGDLLFFAVIQYVERKFGISISVLSEASQSLNDLIRSPRIMNDKEVIFLDIESKRYLMADTVEQGVEGIYIDSSKAKKLVCNFLGVIPNQSQFYLGLAKVS